MPRGSTRRSAGAPARLGVRFAGVRAAAAASSAAGEALPRAARNAQVCRSSSLRRMGVGTRTSISWPETLVVSSTNARRPADSPLPLVARVSRGRGPATQGTRSSARQADPQVHTRALEVRNELTALSKRSSERCNEPPEEATELLRELIRLDTVNPPGTNACGGAPSRISRRARGRERAGPVGCRSGANVRARLGGRDGPWLAFLFHYAIPCSPTRRMAARSVVVRSRRRRDLGRAPST